MNKLLAIVITPIILTFLSFVLAQFDFLVPEGLVDVFQSILSFLALFSFILPLETLHTVLGIYTSYIVLAYSFLSGIWLYKFLIKGFHK